MAFSKKPTGRASSMPAGLAMGGLCGLAVTLLGAGILAKLIDANTLPETSIGYGVMVILMLASFLGALLAYNKIKRQRMLVCMASGLSLFLILLSMTALFFGGQYSGVGVTALLILCGSGLAALLGLRENRGGKTRKIKIPNR